MSRCMLKQRSVPTEFWGEAVAAAIYILNRSPTKALRNVTPYEALTGVKPSVDHLRTFGCLAFVLNPGQQRGKFDSKSEKHVFIGYSAESKGYKLINPLTGKVQVSREVQFHEQKAWNWDNAIGSSHTLEDVLDHSDDDTTSEENQISSCPQATQANTPTSSSEDLFENLNTKYKTLHELYNSCSFALAAGDPSSFDEACHREEWKAAVEEVTQQPGSIFVCQKRYAKGLLKKFGMLNSKSHVTPLNNNEKFQLEDSSRKADERRFRSMVGSLLYLAHTLPDLMFTMGLLSKFVHCPSKHHLGAVKIVLHYVSGTINMGIKFDCVEAFHLLGYIDSNWGGSIDDRRSTTGWVFNLGSGAVAWSSKRQEIIALSSIEAEYVTAIAAACQGVWMRRLLEDMRVDQNYGTTIYCDNQSASTIAKNPAQHDRTRG